jgi:hypothetical protein
LAPTETFAHNPILSYDQATNTFTFLVAGEYFVGSIFNGTVISAIAAIGGTATATQVAAIINGAATYALGEYIVQGTVGSTIVFALTATSITDAELRIAEYQYALGSSKKSKVLETA